MLRAAVDHFVQSTTASHLFSPSETCWFIQFPYELEPGLCLSHSATLASTACTLSTTLVFWVTSIECAFLSHLEDHCNGVQNITSSVPTADLNSNSNSQSQAEELSTRALHAEENELSYLLKVPTDPEQPPPVAPKPHTGGEELSRSLLRFCLTCGEGARRPVGTAVATTVPRVLSKYRKELPYSLWRRVCMQALHAMHRQLTCIDQRERDGHLHAHNACSHEWSPHDDWRIQDSDGIDKLQETTQDVKNEHVDACTTCDGVATGVNRTEAGKGEPSGDTSSHCNVTTGIDETQEDAPLKRRPCMPGMCGACGMHASLPQGGGGGTEECRWEELPGVVTATLRLIHALVREEVLRGDTEPQNSNKQSEKEEQLSKVRARDDDCRVDCSLCF